jgi:hypothetical protein
MGHERASVSSSLQLEAFVNERPFPRLCEAWCLWVIFGRAFGVVSYALPGGSHLMSLPFTELNTEQTQRSTDGEAQEQHKADNFEPGKLK